MEKQDKLIDLYDDKGNLKPKDEFLKEIGNFYDTCASSKMNGFDYLDYITTAENQVHVEETYNTFNFLNRNFYINEEITQKTANDFQKFVNFWNEVEIIDESDTNESMPLNIFINSEGGDIDAALSIISVMRSSKIPINTHVYGRAWSCAFFISICGDYRVSELYASFLFHEGSALFGENAHKFLQFSSFYKKNLEQIRSIITHHTRITENDYQLHKNDDWWLTAEEALEYGIIDKIQDERK